MWVCRGPCGVIGGSAQQQCWVTVSIWGVSLWGECGSDPLFLGALCWISVCIWGVPLWGECGSVEVSVGLLGALCWITVGIWGIPAWGECGSHPLFTGPSVAVLSAPHGRRREGLSTSGFLLFCLSLLCHVSRRAP